MKIIIKIFFIIIFIFLIIAGYQYLIQSNKPKYHPKLTNRTKEFIKSQLNQGNLNWSKINLDQKRKNKNDPKTFSVGNCATVIIPYQIEFIKEKQPCFISLFIPRPKGKIIISLKQIPSETDLENLSAVKSMTINRQYKKKGEKIGENQYLIFEKKSAGVYEKYAFKKINGKVLMLAFIFNTTANLDGIFNNVLISIKIT